MLDFYDANYTNLWITNFLLLNTIVILNLIIVKQIFVILVTKAPIKVKYVKCSFLSISANSKKQIILVNIIIGQKLVVYFKMSNSQSLIVPDLIWLLVINPTCLPIQ